MFNNILYKCFRKIRIVPKKETSKIEKLLTERVKLKKNVKCFNIDENMREKIRERIRQIEEDIGEDVAKDNFKVVVETLKELGDGSNLNGSGRKNLWKLLKKKYPKSSHAVPVGKKDNKGNLITNHKELKHLYLQTYTQRLRNRKIKDEFGEIKELKDGLFNTRLKLAREKKSEPWTLKDLDAALKTLKKDKARDPNGWINELFKDGVAGRNLKLSILHFFNKMKKEDEISDFVRLADVSTIYKGKGAKCELINDRGIFIVTILRSILMKLIYLDYYSILDKSMSDSQVGARKMKNIRNHIWIINGIITDVLSSKSKNPIDIQIFDYKQCFDSLWLQECMNDLYTAGLDDDKFALLYNVNKTVNIAVKTPVGKTARQNIQNVITQGDVFGPMFCSKQVDTFGQECLEESKYTYLYRGEVEIPPLSMVDDVLCVSECGFKTSMAHSYIAMKTDSKKLQFGAQKCKKLHVGRFCEDFKCQTLKVDTWKEVEFRDEETGVDEIEDVHIGEEIMEEKDEEKYEDVISTDGKNIKNVKARVAKGKGIASRILTILDGIPFGKFYFEVALILRNSLLVSSMLCNSESWYNITKAELDLLETVDVKFLRSVLRAPTSTPTEMLYLELGCVPLRQLIRKRRISFLHYIMNEEENSMMYRFLMTQMENRKPRDWISTVLEDLNDLNMSVNLEDIKQMKKSKLKETLNKVIKENALRELTKKKESHSKVKDVKHTTLEMQRYLKASDVKINQEEVQTIFKLRSRMTDVKINFRGKYDSFECEACNEEDEDQKHIIECREILKCKKNNMKPPDIDELFKGSLKKQLEVAQIFLENMDIKEKFKKK